jgi:DNA-binding transcriptional MocR family regulator
MEEFVTEAERRGVLVTGSDHFVVGRGQTPHAIRVCYAWEHRANRLMRGLTVLHEMLNDHISRGHSVI